MFEEEGWRSTGGRSSEEANYSGKCADDGRHCEQSAIYPYMRSTFFVYRLSRRVKGHTSRGSKYGGDSTRCWATSRHVR